jgi:hypothetical protein
VQKAASHWHCWLAQWPWKKQIAQASPFLPHAPSSVPGWHWEFSSQQPAQQAPPGPWQLRWSVRQTPLPSQQPVGQVVGEQGALPLHWPLWALQAWPAGQATHALPPVPQA